jgi:hypothetical protein
MVSARRAAQVGAHHTGARPTLASAHRHIGHGQDYETECTLCGILCCVFLFPFGIICALLMREKRCRRCEWAIDWRGGGGVRRGTDCRTLCTVVQAINSCSRSFWVAGLLGCWVAGLLGCWVAGLLGCWVAGLLGCWVTEEDQGGFETASHGVFADTSEAGTL